MEDIEATTMILMLLQTTETLITMTQSTEAITIHMSSQYLLAKELQTTEAPNQTNNHTDKPLIHITSPQEQDDTKT